MEQESGKGVRASSVRWEILRQALLRRRSSLPNSDERSPSSINRISRKATHGFNLIPRQLVEAVGDQYSNSRDARICYTLPIDGAPKLLLTQRVDTGADLRDFEISNRNNVDTTGLVCHWPSEDVLAYFCLSRVDMFRSKRVIELGAGYGLAGLVIAAISEASEVVISDGNPQVVDYIQRNIDANSGAFGDTKVTAVTLHWGEEVASHMSNSFDVIVASDCTFFKDFHKSLASAVKLLLRNESTSEAIFISPQRGNSLNKFLDIVEETGLHFSVTENYDAEVWKRHLMFENGDESWPSYAKDHCYPLLVRITL
ncbi:Calmodulin-lysine N-methyltransferase [Linum grandiflorum]